MMEGIVERYDAGLLNDFGGGNVEWWQDYIRAELERSHDFYEAQVQSLQADNAALRERVESIVFDLTNQNGEPWPQGSESDRLHFWRDKAIKAAEGLNRAILTKEQS